MALPLPEVMKKLEEMETETDRKIALTGNPKGPEATASLRLVEIIDYL